VRGTLRHAAFWLGLTGFGLAWAAGVSTSLRHSGTLPPVQPGERRHIDGLLAAGDWQHAIQQMRMMLLLQPTMGIAHTLSVVARANGDRESELYALRRATQIDERNPKVHQQLAASLAADPGASREDLLEAVRHARRAAALAPGSAPVRATLAQVWTRLGDRERAAENWKAALQIDPAFEPARAGLRALEAH
jgi:Flp pilus assembly protein TadD